MKLPPKQIIFCEQYVYKCNSNGTKAAIAAGYSEKTARKIASRLLTKVDIRAYIKQLRDKISKKLEISAESLSKELALNMELARSSEQYSASNQAALGMAKLNGLLIDKTEDVTLPEDVKKRIFAMPLEYLERINNGEDKLKVLDEYEQSVKS